jgi:hypothetical protein
VDFQFFQKYLLVIAKRTYKQILSKKEALYYYKYVRKLRHNIKYLENNDVANAIAYVQGFEDKQGRRVRNGVLARPRKALSLACRDVRDVLEGMKRWELTEVKVVCECGTKSPMGQNHSSWCQMFKKEF